MKLTRGIKLAIVLALAGAASGVTAGIVLYPFEVGNVTARADCSGGPGFVVTPVWDTLNVWDVSFFNTTSPADFRANYPYVDRLVLMTATGGRSTGSNEYYHEDASGHPHYDFSPLVDAIEWLGVAGVAPVIVVGNVPLDLARIPAGTDPDYGAFDALTHPPRDWGKYYDYILALATNLTETFGLENASKWEWRVMTEPDNEDWWTGTWEEYFWLYVNTTRAIRSAIPGARVGVGNFMSAGDTSRLVAFVRDLREEAPNAPPNATGYSCYGRGQVGPYPGEVGGVAANWESVLDGQLAGLGLDHVIEEGQILHDEDGHRLWSGDGTELGAAWQAGVLHECIEHGVSRYVQWSFRADSLPAPSLFVHEMYEKVEGDAVVPLSFDYPAYIKPEQRHVDGFAALDEVGGTVSVLLYSHTPERASTRSTRVKVVLDGLPVDIPNPAGYTHYRVDANHSNFFTDWLEYSADLERVPLNEAGGGSRYDLCVSCALSEEDRPKWYQWQWERRNAYSLEQVDWDLGCVADGSHLEFTVDMEANSVSLVQFHD
ncbi:MAG: GH39 family glycosyl hydrolase [Promethearchaeota archaeon]